MAKLPFQRQPSAPVPPAPPAAPPVEAVAVSDSSNVLVIDIQGVSTSFEAMPVGVYSAVVDEVEHIPSSKKSGNPFVKFTFNITDPDFDGRKQFHNCSLVKSALWKLLKTLDALGIPAEGDELRLDLEGMVGLPCSLSLSIEDYQGKSKNDVMEVLPPKSGGVAAARF